jgi:hypothetical protein
MLFAIGADPQQTMLGTSWLCVGSAILQIVIFAAVRQFGTNPATSFHVNRFRHTKPHHVPADACNLNSLDHR